MKILEVATNAWHEVTIEEIDPREIKGFTAKRYSFKWSTSCEGAVAYKLILISNNDVKGLMSLVDYPAEFRIEIKLITASRENVIYKKDKGKKRKEFEGIIGNLIAFAGKQAVDKYGINACLSLFPKTVLRDHYIKEYGMIDAGRQVYLLYEQLNHLILKYNV